MGTHIDIEDRGFDISLVLLGNHGLLGGVHAADIRAVIVADAAVARSHALDPGDPLRFFAVGKALNMTGKGAGGGENTFIFKAGHDIRPQTIAQFGFDAGVEGLEAGRENDRAGFDLFNLLPLVMVDRLGKAGIHALQAFATNHAVEAFLRFGLGLLFGQPQLHFVEARPPSCHGNCGHFSAGHLLDVLRDRSEILLRDVKRFTAGGYVLTLEIAGNRDCRLFPVSHRANGDPGTGLGITTGKDTVLVSGQGDGIGLNGSLTGKGQALVFGQEQRIGRLPDGGDD